MHFSIPIILGVGILSSLGAAIPLPPEGPEWVAEMQSYIKDHQDKLDKFQIKALDNAIILALTRDKKLAPEMMTEMMDAFGEEETANLLTSRSDENGLCQCAEDIPEACPANWYCYETTDCTLNPWPPDTHRTLSGVCLQNPTVQ